MKTILLPFLIILISANAFSQTPERSTPPANNHWLATSKSQKKTAWILLGSGSDIAAIGGIIQLNHENKRSGGWDFDFTGAIVAIVGGALCLVSVPFFISASNSKKKGLQLALTNERLKHSFIHNSVTSLTLKIRL